MVYIDAPTVLGESALGPTLENPFRDRQVSRSVVGAPRPSHGRPDSTRCNGFPPIAHFGRSRRAGGHKEWVLGWLGVVQSRGRAGRGRGAMVGASAFRRHGGAFKHAVAKRSWVPVPNSMFRCLFLLHGRPTPNTDHLGAPCLSPNACSSHVRIAIDSNRTEFRSCGSLRFDLAYF